MTIGKNDPDWRRLELAPGILREPTPDGNRVVLWLRGDFAEASQSWERISSVPGAPLRVHAGVCQTQATIIRAREKLAGLLGRIARSFRTRPGENSWVLPTGGFAEQVGQRDNDHLLVWADEQTPPLDEQAILDRYGAGGHVRKLAKNLFLVHNNTDGNRPEGNGRSAASSSVTPLDQAKELLAVAKKAGDCPRQASALVDLGVIHLREGQVALAAQLFGRALTIARHFKDASLASDAQTNLAMALLANGQAPAALELLHEELNKARAGEDRFQEKLVLSHVGAVHAQMEARAQAIRAYEHAGAIAQQLGDRRHQADLLWHLAIQHAAAGEHALALGHGQQAIGLLRQLGNPSIRGYVEALDRYRLEPRGSRPPAPVPAGGYHQPVILAAGVAAPTREAPHGPGLLRVALSAAKAMAMFIGSGMQRVPAATYQQRLETCAACPQHTGVRCKLCGCFTSVKAWLPHESCPAQKWPR